MLGRFDRRRVRRWSIVAAGLLTVYAALGFFAAPGLVRAKLVEAIQETTGRTVTLGAVRTNPFTLSVTLRDFVLPDRDGQPIVAWRELYINFEVISLWHWAYAFRALRLTEPSIQAVVREDGSVNFSDVMPADTAPPGAPPDTAPPQAVLIGHLVIENGALVYQDRQRTTPFVARIDSISLDLKDFSTRPDESGGYRFDAETDRGERLSWRGDVSTVPPRSSGHLALTGFQARTVWTYLQDQVAYEITGGTVDVEAEYEFDGDTTPARIEVRSGGATVRSLVIVDPRDGTEAVTIPTLTVSGVTADATAGLLRVGEVTTSGGTIRGTYADSVFSLATLFEPRVDPKAPVDSAPTAWRTLLGRLTVTDYTVDVTDRSTSPAAHVVLAPLELTVLDYPSGLPGQAKMRFSTGVNGRGTVGFVGTYSPNDSALAIDLQVQQLALDPFQPYVNEAGRLEIESGTLSLTGRATSRQRGGVAQSGFDGTMRLDNFRATDPKLNEDFVRLGRMDLKRIRYRSHPATLDIREIVVDSGYLRAIISPDRTTNIQAVFDTAAADSIRAAASAAAAEDPRVRAARRDSALVAAARADTLAARRDSAARADRAAADSAAATVTTIGEIRIVNSAMNFSDQSLTPNFAVAMLDLNGSIRGLSSAQMARADVDIAGQVDRYAPVTMVGQINPLAESPYTDITLRFSDIELTTFTPYSGKFAGYRIDRGKLSLDLHYTLDGRYLKGENRVLLDQLTLGEKVESPDATSLPVKLGIALLKDSKGVIDLNVPVEGDVDDPSFRILPIVLKVLVNVFVKAVTSPFKLLGALFGGGEELSYVAFAPGSAVLSGVESAKLDSLARALGDRPGLRLDVRGAAAAAVDSAVLAERAVREAIRPGAAGDTTPYTARERERVFRLYRTRFNLDAAALIGAEAGRQLTREQRDAAVADSAVRRLAAASPVTDAALRELAITRATAIKDHLVTTRGIEEERVFFLDAEISRAPPQGGMVRVTLGLDAR